MLACRSTRACTLNLNSSALFVHFKHTQLTPDTRVVLVEGNYLSLPLEPWCRLQGLFDERWLITCDPAVARARVIARHVGTGNTVEQATRRADENDVPNGALVEAETRRTGWATRVVESV